MTAVLNNKTAALSVLLCLLATKVAVVSSSLVVTLGDGYAAGTGLFPIAALYDDESCWSETDLTPGGKYASQFGLPHVNLACFHDERIVAPDTDVDLELLGAWNTLREFYPEETPTGWSGSLLIVTTGLDAVYGYPTPVTNTTNNWMTTNEESNEVGDAALSSRDRIPFAAILRRCWLRPFCQIDDDLFDIAQSLDRLEERLELIYNEIINDAFNAKLLVVGYPTLFVPDLHFFCFVRGISRREARALDSVVSQLNQRISNVVGRIRSDNPTRDIEYVDNTYTNKFGACAPWRRGINRINRFQVSQESAFHPNQRGYDETYATIETTLAL